jgi:hypothetical protein
MHMQALKGLYTLTRLLDTNDVNTAMVIIIGTMFD